MPYLMIRNPGVAPSEGFTMLGVSTTRYAGDASCIGMFGTGSNHAINVLLRHDLPPVIFTGNLRMDFYAKPMPVSDGLNVIPLSRVCVKYSGTLEDGRTRNATDDLGFVLEHGSHDWTNLHMGLREFVSNALDRTHRETNSFEDVEIEVVDKPRAKRGHTSVFVPLTPEVHQFYQQLPKRFLHFGYKAGLNQKILPKQSQDNKVYIYKKGVLVATIEGESLFDYNLGAELELDESRNARDWQVRYACSQALASASTDHICRVVKAVLDGKEYWETSKLDTSYLKSNYESETIKKQRQERWQTAWKTVAGDNAVATSGTPGLETFVRAKGFTPIPVPEQWHSVVASYGVATEAQVLTNVERDGLDVMDATVDAQNAVDFVWALIEKHGMTNGKTKPPVKVFRKAMEGGGQRLGFYRPEEGTVYINNDIAGNTNVAPILLTQQLLVTAIEECGHHASGAADFSRDMQDFVLNLLVYVAKEGVERGN